MFGKKKDDPNRTITKGEYDNLMAMGEDIALAVERAEKLLKKKDPGGYVTVEAFTVGGIVVPCDPEQEDLFHVLITAWEEKTQRILEERVRELHSMLDLEDPRWVYQSTEILPFGPPEPLYKLTPAGEARAAELAERDRSAPNPYTTPPVFTPPTLQDVEQAQAT